MPEDLAETPSGKARGKVQLPLHIRWSGPAVTYDLADRADRARVYEQVLREGTDDDVRRYVDPNDLLELWDDLVLPPTSEGPGQDGFFATVASSSDAECAPGTRRLPRWQPRRS